MMVVVCINERWKMKKKNSCTQFVRTIFPPVYIYSVLLLSIIWSFKLLIIHSCCGPNFFFFFFEGLLLLLLCSMNKFSFRKKKINNQTFWCMHTGMCVYATTLCYIPITHTHEYITWSYEIVEWSIFFQFNLFLLL